MYNLSLFNISSSKFVNFKLKKFCLRLNLISESSSISILLSEIQFKNNELKFFLYNFYLVVLNFR